MSNKILVTDTLFIYDEHVKKLEAAGFEVERLEKPDASEDELIQALKGKVGYIFGGIEQVTKKVIDASPDLKAIALIAVGYEYFIPAWEYALENGIAISIVPGGPTQEVSEWAVTAALIMNRQFLELGLAGEDKFAVTKGIESQKVGIIGLGKIGSRIAEILKVFRPQSISYFGRSHQPEHERDLGVEYLELEYLLKQSDIIFVCVADLAKGLLGQKELATVKDGALLVNVTHPGIIDEEALFAELKSGRIRAISDHPMQEKFKELPYSNWYAMKTSNTITEAGSKLMSDMATESMINLLKTGKDQYTIS